MGSGCWKGVTNPRESPPRNVETLRKPNPMPVKAPPMFFLYPDEGPPPKAPEGPPPKAHAKADAPGKPPPKPPPKTADAPGKPPPKPPPRFWV